ncbi:dihydroorotate dehydrogenase [bacterium]
MSNLNVKIKELEFNNPVIVASGTFGYGNELTDIIDIEKLGGIVTKTITLEERQGNEQPRLLETTAGLLNSIGLQNPGVKTFIDEIMPFWKSVKNVRLIVSVGGNDIHEYIEVCKILKNEDRIDAFELNISCPNVKKGCMAIGQDEKLISKLIYGVKGITEKPVIVKLSPNFIDVVHAAKVCEDAECDALSLVNTFLGMAIAIDKKKPYFKNTFAGYSGPAVKPMALRFVYEAAKAVKIPVIGMGGIMNTDDALEFMIAGANLVSLGTANFVNPIASLEIINGLNEYCEKNNIDNIKDIIKSISLK